MVHGLSIFARKAIRLDGKAVAKKIETTLINEVHSIQEQLGRPPQLATILVGDDPASRTYVQMKEKACKRIGIMPKIIYIQNPKQISTQGLIARITSLNEDPLIDGILLQHPIAKHIEERRCFDAISIEKDVDGVTTAGFGKLAMGEAAYGSATATGIMALLEHYQIPIEGKHVVIVGRSAIVGKPMQALFLNANATVTVCHSKTLNLSDHVRQADILVGALGKPEFIKSSWIKDNAVIIDAGYHSTNVGDIELASAIPRCGAYTPVPGGVGPMTIACLMQQTVIAAAQKKLALAEPASPRCNSL